MDADPVAVGADNSLGYKYIGEYGGHKYYYSDDNKTKSQAQADAIAKGGYLWVIESSAEETYVKNLMSTQSLVHWVWLGLAYDYTDTSWKWINGNDYSSGWLNWNSNLNSSTDSSGALENPVARTYIGEDTWRNVQIGQDAKYIIVQSSLVNRYRR